MLPLLLPSPIDENAIRLNITTWVGWKIDRFWNASIRFFLLRPPQQFYFVQYVKVWYDFSFFSLLAYNQLSRTCQSVWILKVNFSCWIDGISILLRQSNLTSTSLSHMTVFSLNVAYFSSMQYCNAFKMQFLPWVSHIKIVNVSVLHWLFGVKLKD